MGIFSRLRRNQPATTVTATPPTAMRPLPAPGQPRFAVLDVETTGLDPANHRVIEVAVVTTDPWGRVLDEWATRINPEGPVGATHIHGLTQADVETAPPFAAVIAHLNQRLAGAALAAHNATFDLAFLRAEYNRAGWELPDLPTLCTLEASEYHLPHLDRRRLSDCCWAVGTPLTGAHSALGDARATATVLAAFMHPHLGFPPPDQHLALPGLALNVRWPASPTRATRRTEPTATASASPRGGVPTASFAPAPPAQALVDLVEQFSLIDALDEGAPTGAVTYLEKLAEVLEDGVVTPEETADLEAVAATMNLTTEDMAAANRAFVLALAHVALVDGKVSRAERAELQTVASALDVDTKVLPALLEHAEHARHTRLSADLGPLPSDWPHGDPLRVGDKVVFTGCDDTIRNDLEKRSESLGVRIIGSVSPKVAMLVADGTFDGTKAARARELGTRTVHPDQYTILLQHLQPALPRELKPLPTPKQPQTTAPGPAGTPTPPPADPIVIEVNPAAVRRWGREHGWELGARGRLPGELIEAYKQAHVAEA